MATSNFNSINSRGIFVNYESDEDGADEFASEHIEYSQEYIIDLLKEQGLNVSEQNGDMDNGEIFASVTAKGISTDQNHIIVYLTQKYGYYSGANVDYSMRVFCAHDWEEYWLEDSIPLNDNKDISATAVKRLESQARELERKISKVLKASTTVLRRVATFSNGESVYERA